MASPIDSMFGQKNGKQLNDSKTGSNKKFINKFGLIVVLIRSVGCDKSDVWQMVSRLEIILLCLLCLSFVALKLIVILNDLYNQCKPNDKIGCYSQKSTEIFIIFNIDWKYVIVFDFNLTPNGVSQLICLSSAYLVYLCSACIRSTNISEYK